MRARITAGTRRHKFNAVPTVVDGIRFASKAEAKFYAELKWREKAGLVTGLVLQPRFDLHVKGVKVAAYVADFSYAERESTAHPWVDRITDVKGMKTPIYRLKKKMAEAEYGISITEVAR